MNRRQFLAASCKTVLAASGVVGLAGCPAVLPYAPIMTPSRVAAIRGNDLATMARDALDAFGGAGAIIQPGESVFIKPNFGGMGMVKYNPITAGDSAKPELVLAVAEECLKAGARAVVIGEAGQVTRWDWVSVRLLDDSESMADAVARLNHNYGGRLSLACLHADSPGWDLVPSCTSLGAVAISRLVSRADKVISIPVIKTHRWTQVTGSLKNFVGVTSVKQYGLGQNMRMLLHQAGIEQTFLDIVRAVKPCFTLVDCSICCEGDGPHVLPGYWGTTVDMRDRLGSWLVLASTDLVAADATAARVISHPAEDVNHLRMAWEQGLGQWSEDAIELIGERLDSLRVPWKPASHVDGFAEVIIPGIHLLMDNPTGS